MTMTKASITVKWENDEGEEVEHTFPAINEVCGRCEGYGTHLNPSIGQHAYTLEEFNEAFDDDESREAYFTRGGMYDVRCEQCHGNKVIQVIDEEHMPERTRLLSKSGRQWKNVGLSTMQSQEQSATWKG